jgi:Protein of unknown function (DUF1583) C domain
MTLSSMTLMLATAVSAQLAEANFSQDFRGQPLHPAVKLFGPDAGRVVQSENRGLRITLPATRKKSVPVGVATAFAVHGDFEITAAYEILKADKPSGAPGAGVNLRVIVGNPMREAAGLARYVRKGGREVYFVTRNSAATKTKPKQESFPTQAKSGKLRLKRTGSTLYCLVAEGAGNPFREISQTPFVTDDCMVRFTALTGKSPAFLDVRFIDLDIHGEALPNAPPGRGSGGWIKAVLIGGMGTAVVVIVVISVWRWRRRRTGG